jgi:hypothetical protein
MQPGKFIFHDRTFNINDFSLLISFSRLAETWKFVSPLLRLHVLGLTDKKEEQMAQPDAKILADKCRRATNITFKIQQVYAYVQKSNIRHHHYNMLYS